MVYWEPENSNKTLKPGFAKYVVDANLFRIGSTNPQKKIQPLFFWGFYIGGFCPDAFCLEAFCRGIFDLEPNCHGSLSYHSLIQYNDGDIPNQILSIISNTHQSNDTSIDFTLSRNVRERK